MVMGGLRDRIEIRGIFRRVGRFRRFSRRIEASENARKMPFAGVVTPSCGRTPAAIFDSSEIPAEYLIKMANCLHTPSADARAASFGRDGHLGPCALGGGHEANAATALAIVVQSATETLNVPGLAGQG
jgi:hypothetical protein